MGVLDTVTVGSLRLDRFELVLPPERYDEAAVGRGACPPAARGPRDLERELDRAGRRRR